MPESPTTGWPRGLRKVTSSLSLRVLPGKLAVVRSLQERPKTIGGTYRRWANSSSWAMNIPPAGVSELQTSASQPVVGTGNTQGSHSKAASDSDSVKRGSGLSLSSKLPDFCCCCPGLKPLLIVCNQVQQVIQIIIQP